jgi:hypothetical protein
MTNTVGHPDYGSRTEVPCTVDAAMAGAMATFAGSRQPGRCLCADYATYPDALTMNMSPGGGGDIPTRITACAVSYGPEQVIELDIIGTNVRIGLTPAQARQLGQAITRTADESTPPPG